MRLNRSSAVTMVPLIVVALVILGTHLEAQWMKYPTAGVPRKTDGSVNMTAPTPRMADGKPDFSGIWTTAEPNRGTGASARAGADDKPGDPAAITASRQMRDIGVDLPGGLPYQPWLIPIVKQRTANDAIDDPHIRCLPDNFLRAYGLPHLLKFIHTPNLLVVLNEMNAGYRQAIHGRPATAQRSDSLVARVFVGKMVRRYSGGRHDRIARRYMDRLEWKRAD